MSTPANTLHQLQSDLVHLQDRGAVVLADLRKSNELFRRHFGELYLWWREARNAENWLEAQYAGLDRRIRSVRDGINFGPLFWLIWGNSNGLTNQKADRYSRAMNAIHHEFERRPQLYLKDGPAKLAYFIQQKGGVTALAGYSAPEAEATQEDDAATPVTTAQFADRRAIKTALLKLSNNLHEYGHRHIVTFPAYITTNEQNYSVLLVQHTKDGLDLISATHDSDLIDTILAETIKRRFDASVFALRPLLELIQTQCLPKHLEGLAKRLTDRASLEDGTKKKYTAYRRVLYRPSENQFLLSPMNALSGVVSIAVPNFPLILEDCQKDVFLPIRERSDIEKSLLRNFEFNLYDVERPSQTIPRYEEPDSASHAVTLRHRLNANQFIGLSFWPFYDSLPQPQDQLDIDPEYVLDPLWQAHLSKDAFKRLNDEFLEKWLNSHAHHLTREPHALVRVTFTETHWLIEFVFKDGQFENALNVEVVPISQQGSPITVHFQSKDWVPVIQSLAFLPITDPVEHEAFDNDDSHDEDDDTEGQSGYYPLKSFVPEEAANYKGAVWLELNHEVIRFHFDTTVFGGSQHTIYIPTTDDQGQRATRPFLRYHPEVTHDASQSVSPEDDDLERIAEEWPEAAGIEP